MNEQYQTEWEATFDAISDWICLIDVSTRQIFRSNKAGERLFDIPLDEIIGQTCCKLIHGTDVPIARCPLDSMLRSQQRESIEFQTLDDNRWLQVVVDPVLEPDGQIDHVVHIVHDITKFKKAEEELLRRQAQVRDILETSLDISYKIDWNTQAYEYISHAIEDVTGFSVHEFKTMGLPEIIKRYHPDSLKKHKDALNEALSHKGGGRLEQQLEVSFKCKDGNYRWLNDCRVIIYDAESNPVSIIGSVRDITDNKKIEEERVRNFQHLLALSNAALAIQQSHTVEDVFQAVSDQIVSLGLNAVIYELNEDRTHLKPAFLTFKSNLIRKAEKLTGLSAGKYQFEIIPGGYFDEIITARKTVFNILDIRPFAEALPKLIRPLANKLKQLLNFDRTITAPMFIDSQVDALLAVLSNDLRESDMSTITIFANQVSTAINNARLLERVIEDANVLEECVKERTQELQDAQEKMVRQERLAALGLLAGGVGHELRNPLGVITNAVYYLKMICPGDDAKEAEYLSLIQTNALEATRIINDLLGFARANIADPSSISVEELVSEVISQHSPPETIHLEVRIPEKLPTVFIDPNQVKQIISNLVTNAYQAMPSGGQLSITAREIDREVSISFADSGTGIPPENLEKIFEPLFTTKANGIGLGLAISKNLVEVNQGRIEVESKIGEGSVFRLYLPIHIETQK
jgi:PAS domain S-box-containing protein